MKYIIQFEWHFAPCQVIRNPESGIQVIMACGIQNPANGIQNLESSHLWNPEFIYVESGIHRHGMRNPQTWNPESTAWNPESRTFLDYLTWGETLQRLCLFFRQQKSRANVIKVSNAILNLVRFSLYDRHNYDKLKRINISPNCSCYLWTLSDH